MRQRRLTALLLVLLVLAAGLVGYVVLSSSNRITRTLGSTTSDATPGGPRETHELPPLPEDRPTTDLTDTRRSAEQDPEIANRPDGRSAAGRGASPRYLSGGWYENLFRPKHEPVPVTLASLSFTRPTPDGAVLTLPAGYHEFSLFLFSHGERFPEDVVIQGAGMDATILRIQRHHLSVDYPRLTFRDLTIDAGAEQVFRALSQSHGHISVRFDRCRVVHIGSGSAVHTAGDLVVWATDSRFEGGYGQFSTPGALFTGKTVKARLERCFLLGPIKGLSQRSSGSFSLVGCESLGAADEDFEEGVAVLEDCEHRPYDEAEAASLRDDFLEAFTRESGEVDRVLWLIEQYKLDRDEITRRAKWFDLFVESPEGTVFREVRIPAGVHDWNPDTIPESETEGLVVRGAGRDKTLLRLVGSDVRRLDVTWRDLTLNLEKREAMKFSNMRARTRFERCRVIGFDKGSGHSAAFSSQHGYFLGTDTEFVAGYGKRPTSGCLFRTTNVFLARLVNCLVRIPGKNLWGKRREISLCLEKSRLVDIDPRQRIPLARMKDQRLLPGTKVEYAESEDRTANREPWPFSKLNPAWGRGHARQRE